MEYRIFSNIYILRLEKGEEIISSIKLFCEKENILLGKIEGLGACDNVVVGLYDVDRKVYHKKEFNEPFEITSLIGNISTMDDETYLHLHITLANKDMKAFGGHLYSATISATCELFITRIDGKVNRKKDEETGLNLYDFV